MGTVGVSFIKSMLFLLAALLLCGCAASVTPPPAASNGMSFKADERAAIERHYAAERLRPATAPATRYKAGDILDSGSRPQPLPSALQMQLPYLAEPYARLVVGADVILVNRNTHTIVDVVPSVAY